MDALVTQSEDVAWGAIVIAGTRVPVDTLFEYLEAGKSLDEFLEQFPTVPRDTAIAILERAKARVAAEAVSG
jgi:uncharacterized protein (DUF433 family)